MKVTGHRVLVLPDDMPTESASGLILPSDRDHQSTSGTVYRVGDGSARDARIRTATIRRCIEIVAQGGGCKELAAYQAKCELVSNLREGDHVIFPPYAGMTIEIERESYVLLNEDDVVIQEREE